MHKKIILWSSLALVLAIIVINVAALLGSTKNLDLYLRSLTEASILSLVLLTLVAGWVAQRYLKVVLLSVSALVLALLISTIEIKLGSDSLDKIEADVRIASFSKMGRNKDARNIDLFLQEMSNEKIQIIALQEVTEEELLTIDRRGMYLHVNTPLATAIYSAWPIEEIIFPKYWFQVVRTNGYLVVNVHMPKFSSSIRLYERKYDALFKLLREFESEKVILIGDLNITKYDENYQSLLRLGFIDSYSETGRGSGYTFPAKARRMGMFGPFLRIDYILVKDIKPVYHYRLDHAYGSDHYPIAAGLSSE